MFVVFTQTAVILAKYEMILHNYPIQAPMGKYVTTLNHNTVAGLTKTNI